MKVRHVARSKSARAQEVDGLLSLEHRDLTADSRAVRSSGFGCVGGHARGGSMCHFSSSSSHFWRMAASFGRSFCNSSWTAGEITFDGSHVVDDTSWNAVAPVTAATAGRTRRRANSIFATAWPVSRRASTGWESQVPHTQRRSEREDADLCASSSSVLGNSCVLLSCRVWAFFLKPPSSALIQRWPVGDTVHQFEDYLKAWQNGMGTAFFKRQRNTQQSLLRQTSIATRHLPEWP